MEIKDIEKIERVKGIASTVKADDSIPVYSAGVEKFLTDNQSKMGDKWVKKAGERLYGFHGKNKEGDVLGSSTDMGVAKATFCPEIPLITGQQLLGLYKQAGDKNPFGDVYIDFGVQINGSPKINSAQAKILLDDFKDREIKLEQGRVPDFVQLRLEANQDAGLVYRLAEDISSDDIDDISVYPFQGRVEKNGLSRAFFYGYGRWGAYGSSLSDSDGDGRVVRYDAEGVAPKKSSSPESDLVSTLKSEFLTKFQ